MGKKLLVVADLKDWSFDKIYKNLKKHCAEWKVDVTYISDKGEQKYYLRHDHDKFDLILYLCDWNPNFLINSKIPKEKVLLALRSDVPYSTNPSHSFYKNKRLLKKTVGGIVVANKTLAEKFSGYHDFIRIAEGGVDISIFKPRRRELHSPPVVGWAGSWKNFGIKYRGLDRIEEACKEVGYVFKPAYREDKWRNEYEMSRYYMDDIDIYADMSKAAGRQNGLLEAGACGKALISTDCGVAKDLIVNGLDGFIVRRTSVALKEALVRIISHAEEFGVNIRRKIRQKWSWEAQAKKFEEIFNEFWEPYYE